MAAMMDSYQPEGINFSQHYQGATRGFDDEEELDEGDIVKSKPTAKYLPLVNEVPEREQYRGRLGSPGGSGIGAQSGGWGSSGGGSGTEQQNKQFPPNGQVPIMESPHELPQAPTKPNDSLGRDSGIVLAVAAGREDERSDPLEDPTETETDKDFEDSTTALLRRYTMERNGRPTSIHFGPGGEIVGSGWLSEILVTGHKKCSVTLEEDCISWRFLSRKDGEKPLLWLQSSMA